MKNNSILITGGTGSFGQKFVDFAFNNLSPKKLVIFSRDELKQFDMASRFPEEDNPHSIFYWGCKGSQSSDTKHSLVLILLYMQPMKQIVAAEYNPLVATNGWRAKCDRCRHRKWR